MQAFIIALRNDLNGSLAQFEDCWPNTSQKNSVYDGVGQTGYLRMADVPGDPVVNGDAFVSGSRMNLLNAAGVTGALADAILTAPGADAGVTQQALFGLSAYLRDRVHVGVGVVDLSMSTAQADAAAAAIYGLAIAGNALTLAILNNVLQVATGQANTDLGGATIVGSTSFGSVQEVLRILSGEVFRVRANTVTTLPAGGGSLFRSLAQRTALIAAADDPTLWYGQGAFLTSADAGFAEVLRMHDTSEFRASSSSGKLRDWHDSVTPLLRTDQFAYTAAGVNVGHVRAFDISGTAVPATGIAPFITCYGADGSVLHVP